MAYQTVIAQGRRCLIGQHITFEQTQCFGLKVGERIIQIGHHMSTSSYEDKFYPYATYSGQIILYEERYVAFLLPEGGVTGLSNPADSVYFLYQISLTASTLYSIVDKYNIAHPLYPLFHIYQKGYWAYPVRGISEKYFQKILKKFHKEKPVFPINTFPQ